MAPELPHGLIIRRATLGRCGPSRPSARKATTGPEAVGAGGFVEGVDWRPAGDGEAPLSSFRFGGWERREDLRGQGAPIFREPSLGLDHNWQAWVHDHDGNAIEFMQLTEESPQRARARAWAAAQ